MRRQNKFIETFLRSNAPPEVLRLWLSTEVQQQWSRLYSITPKEKRRCTCFIMFCQAKRSQVKQQHPELLPAKITSLLGEMWRNHKEANDEVYKFYVEKDRKQVFFSKHRPALREKYPDIVEEDVEILLTKMYNTHKNLEI